MRGRSLRSSHDLGGPRDDADKLLILASRSPRRRRLLRRLGLPFRVLPSGIPEIHHGRSPREIVKRLALLKARHVARRLKRGIVLGADTLVIVKGRIFGQPRNRREAFEMLSRLSGTTHRVYTGVAVVDAYTDRSLWGVEVSRVRMRQLSFKQLRILSQRHLDKAGAYAIQERKDPIARLVAGSYDNVVGLPLRTVRRLLRRFGIKPSEKSI